MEDFILDAQMTLPIFCAPETVQSYSGYKSYFILWIHIDINFVTPTRKIDRGTIAIGYKISSFLVTEDVLLTSALGSAQRVLRCVVHNGPRIVIRAACVVIC